MVNLLSREILWLSRSSLGLLLLFSFEVWGQSNPNLLEDGGFELHDLCPNSAGDMMVNDPWDPHVGSPDYYHICGSNEGGAPENFAGYQLPHGDSAYIGLATYTSFFAGGQESIKANLLQPLNAGTKYRISFWISPCDSMNYHTCCIGATFEEPPWPPYSQNLSTVELVLPSDSLDASAWYQLDAEYTAVGGENVVYLGNFRPDSLSLPFYKGEITPDYDAACFYIDDVEIYEDDLVSIESNSLPEFKIASLVGNELSVEVSESMTLILLDLSGRLVRSTLLVKGINGIDVTSVPAGLYVATVYDGSGRITGSQKLIITR